jgi:NADPH-dependent 2,4-dienoyl-CoA reductase/sulfur reductase-like enzyme/nitrite reductase/ring-hydroxylating ferredoxin subunit
MTPAAGKDREADPWLLAYPRVMETSDGSLQGPDLASGVPFEQLREGQPLLGNTGGEAAILVRVGNEAHAVGATCAHYGGPLAEGLVVDGTLRCPWHHACYDLRTGQVLGAPALSSIPCYQVRREGNLVRVIGKKAVAKPAGANSAHPSSVVIVGAGPAGTSCAEALRREGYSGTITMIGAEAPVDRPNLSKDYLAGNAPEEWLPLRTPEALEEQRITLELRSSVRKLDVAARRVELSNGKWLEYGALVLATGADPIRLPIDGADRPHVHLLRTLADSRAIIDAAARARGAVIIGASFIGLEAAASLRTRGLDVTVVGPEPLPLARMLGDEVGALVQQIHEGKGERFRLGRKPVRITDTKVVLDDGEELATDLVVMGVGVRPRLELAEAAALNTDRGVIVDERMRTSSEHVYAIGDIARYPYGGELVRIEHFAVAERHGRTAAYAILGRPPPMHDVPFFWSAHHDVTLSYVGHAERFDRVVVTGSLTARDAAVGYLDRDRVRAVLTVNRDLASLRAGRAFEVGDQTALRGLLGI